MLENELLRREQIAALQEAAGCWSDKDHPELSEVSQAFVRELRDRSRYQLDELNRDASENEPLSSGFRDRDWHPEPQKGARGIGRTVIAGVRAGEAQKTERLLRSLKFVPVDWDIAKAAGDLLCQWRLKGWTLSLPDTTIAAVALAYGWCG